MLFPRRQFLLGTMAGVMGATLPSARADEAAKKASQKAPTSNDLELVDVQVPGDRALGRRFLLCLPKHLQPGEKVPLVVLLHGLGETGDERTGVYAWVERYGLLSAYERLRRLPIVRSSKREDWTEARLAEVNADLAQKAFRGLCLVCPFTPNIHKTSSPAASLDTYANWLTEVVIPRARKDAPVLDDPASTTLDGCSLGGYMALEVFARKPDVFGALGAVQAAVGKARALGYAQRLAVAMGNNVKPVHLLSSQADPFLAGNQMLHSELSKRNVPCNLRVLPGPHDQPWLREAGSIEMLLSHDRRRQTP